MVILQIQYIFSSNVTNSYLRSSTTYSIEVAAVNSAGTGPYSPPVIATTNKSKYNESIVTLSGGSINVTGVLMTVDSTCSVAISSLSEGECLTSDDKMIIIMGVAGTVAGITLVAIIVVIVILVVVKHHHPNQKANE